MDKDLLQIAFDALNKGMKKIEFQWNGLNVTAYWVKDLLRIDVKGAKPVK